MGVTVGGKRQEIAIGIALQTKVLHTCAVHNQLYSGDEQCAEDENMARAFAVAMELIHTHAPFAEVFRNDAHALTDLLSQIIGSAPICCPECMVSAGAAQLAAVSVRSNEVYASR